MSTRINHKRLKRRFKKKIYHLLVALNDFDFSRLRPVCYLLLIAGILFVWAKLPTEEVTNTDDTQIIAGANLSADIRTAVATSTDHAVDIVALFLPPETSAPALSETYAQEPLYSFYLTGKELLYLAEGAVSAITKENRLYLDGLNFTYHKNRLPFNRVTSLTTAFGTEIEANTLYHLVSTEDIFDLFRYISYRSFGILQIEPKDTVGTLLTNCPEGCLEIILANTDTFHTMILAENTVTTNTVPSLITTRYGFNLIDLIKEPNRITVCVIALLVALLVLLGYMIPKMKRIRIWFRIHRIRSKKRSSHTPSYKLRQR